jgi:hypothetical protein
MTNITEIFKDAIYAWHGRTHYQYQLDIADAIFTALLESQKVAPEGAEQAEILQKYLDGETYELAIEISRQSGKTTGIVDAVEFILATSLRYFGRPLSIGIFAPEREQATTDFDRLKNQFAQIKDLGFATNIEGEGALRFPKRWNSRTVRLYTKKGEYLGEVYIFPVNKGQAESKTLDLIIIEEAQNVDDKRLKNMVFPMGASTNAPRVYIGTAGYRNCLFKSKVESGKRLLKIELPRVFQEREQAFRDSGDPKHLLYRRYVEHEMREEGLDPVKILAALQASDDDALKEVSEYISTQFLLKWVIGAGNFTSEPQLDAMIEKGRGYIMENKPIPVDPKNPKKGTKPAPNCYVGIDVAKIVDRTVVTIERDHPEIEGKVQFCYRFEIQGDNYEDQYDIIVKVLDSYDSIRRIAIDSTGQGDFMPDKFVRRGKWGSRAILRVKFSMESKDAMYKILKQSIKNVMVLLPDTKVIPANEKAAQHFRKEMLDLQQEYKGQYLSVHHPDGSDENNKPFHDDHPDSWALCEFGRVDWKKHAPGIG